MQLLIVTNCSARKTAVPAPALHARSLPRGMAGHLAADWRARRSDTGGRIAARRLYAGRGFSLAQEVARSAGAQLRVVSAGMGLIHPETAVPPYSLTLAQGAPDCILSRAPKNQDFTPQEWWEAIRSRSPGAKPFERLLASYPSGLLLIALTGPYLEMISAEVASLSESALDRVRIVGLTRARVLPEELRPYVMPYDSRLNDVNSEMRGTAFDFPSRALVHFADLVKLDRRIADARSHSKRVRQSLAHLLAPELNPRRRVTDKELGQTIKQLKEEQFSRTTGLRHLRRELGIACEQARFMAAWGQHS